MRVRCRDRESADGHDGRNQLHEADSGASSGEILDYLVCTSMIEQKVASSWVRLFGPSQVSAVRQAHSRRSQGVKEMGALVCKELDALAPNRGSSLPPCVRDISPMIRHNGCGPSCCCCGGWAMCAPGPKRERTVPCQR